jgi:hypothetical protein
MMNECVSFRKLLSPAPTTSHLIPSRLYTNEETFIPAITDVKYPQKEHRNGCKSVIYGSIKKEQLKGFGLSKVIVSFDCGPCFVNKNFITIFAIDNESEIYYTSSSILSSSIKVNPIICPAMVI